MKKLGVAIALVVLFLAAGVIWRQKQQARDLKAEAVSLRAPVEQVTALQTENRRMTAQLHTAKERLQSDLEDLTRLKAQGEHTRQVEQENARVKAELRKIEKADAAKAAAEFDGHAALPWVTTVLAYAREHQGQFPASLNDPALFSEADGNWSPELKAKIIQTADKYELLYHGKQEDLTNPPIEATILIRSRQAWQNAEGKWVKDYGFGGGSSTTHTETEADGSFEKFESIRLPRTNGR